MSVHSFDTDIAVRVGVSAAVIYQNILFWTQKNLANEKHIIDGKVWTYNSVKAWAKLFDYLTENQIRTALAKLVEAELVAEGNYNQIGCDRTKWYGVSVEIHLGKNTNGFVESRKPIPDSKPDHKPDGKQYMAQAPAISADHGQNKRDAVSDILQAWASPSAVASFIAYRRKAKAKALTETAARRLASSLQDIFNAGGDCDDALGMAEERGWQTVKADWYFNAKGNGNGNGYNQHIGANGSRPSGSGSSMVDAFAAVAARRAAADRRN
jgi:hypothetical protein